MEETADPFPVALGSGGAILVTYAPEIEAAAAAYKSLKKLTAEPEVTEEMLDELEQALDELPTFVSSAFGDMGSPTMGELQTVGELLQERKVVKDGARFGAFLFLANRISDTGGEEEMLGDEMLGEEPMQEEYLA